MKNLFTLVVLICFSFTAANAQDKVAVKAERVTKVESKEALKKAQVQPKTIDAATLEQKRANVTRLDANNAKKMVLTQEQKEAVTREKAVKVTNAVKAD
jgi:hypothetical protein